MVEVITVNIFAQNVCKNNKLTDVAADFLGHQDLVLELDFAGTNRRNPVNHCPTE